jgi:hypothetical protein
MKKIKFELYDDEDHKWGEHYKPVFLDVSLNGEIIDDYLVAFKAFLIACSFTEDTISTIQTEEQFYLNNQKDLTDSE